MKKAIQITGLEKKYNHFTLGKLNLSIPSGMVIGLIGENGAGKTTLIKSILNIIKVDAGSISIFGKDFLLDETSIKKDIGVVLDNTFFPEIITTYDVNRVMKEFYDNWDEKAFFGYLETFQLPKTQIKQLSKGMRKKLEIATALSHHPKLLILDEPTSGLDPVVRSEVLDIFRDFIKDEDHTILFSTHITTDLEHIADYIVFLDQGKILLEETIDDVLESYGILKCDEKELANIDKNDILRVRRNKYQCEVLVKDRISMAKKYKKYVIDKISLDELMVLFVKGEEK